MPFSALVSFPASSARHPRAARRGAVAESRPGLSLPPPLLPGTCRKRSARDTPLLSPAGTAPPFPPKCKERKNHPVKARPMKEAGRWEAAVMLGVPLDEVKKQPLTLRATDSEGETSSRTLTVTPLRVKWIEQQLSVEPKFVTPPPKARKQIEKDRAHTGAVLSAISPVPSWKLPFQRPVRGTVSSSFAGRRVFNGQPRSPHTGTDLRGPTGHAPFWPWRTGWWFWPKRSIIPATPCSSITGRAW